MYNKKNNIMSPLKIEFFNPLKNTWEIANKVLNPGEMGGLPNINTDGSKEVFVFKCNSDNDSTIFRVPEETDIWPTDDYHVLKTGTEDWKVVKTLTKENPTFRITLRLKIDRKRVIVRFTHF